MRGKSGKRSIEAVTGVDGGIVAQPNQGVRERLTPSIRFPVRRGRIAIEQKRDHNERNIDRSGANAMMGGAILFCREVRDAEIRSRSQNSPIMDSHNLIGK